MAKTNYHVQIQGADNGILVEVGCKRLVFKTDEIDTFLSDLKLFITGGYAAEKTLRQQYFGDDDAPIPESIYPEAQLGVPNR